MMRNGLNAALRPLRALSKAGVFFLKVFPMLPSGLVDRLTPAPVIEKVIYPTTVGEAQGELYRPPGPGPHPGIVVCLGVVPFEVDHPQVPVLGRALARAGFAALLYWSPAMRAFRLDPADAENIALAYAWLTGRADVDAARSGLLGTCVGGAFALMAAANPRVNGQTAFVSAYAPYSSMAVFARDIASASRSSGGPREAWRVDPLTRKVFAHALTAGLAAAEGERLRAAYLDGQTPPDWGELSEAGRAVWALLAARDYEAAGAALAGLPAELRGELEAMSPLNHLEGLRAPLVTLLHDEGDAVIPVGESRRLFAALAGRAGVRYTEMHFSHLDPTKGRLPWHRLAREFAKFFAAMYPLFRCVTK